MSEKIKVGVYGASGYAGQDAVEILSKHPNVELVFGTSNTYAGQPIPYTNLTYTPHDQADRRDRRPRRYVPSTCGARVRATRSRGCAPPR